MSSRPTSAVLALALSCALLVVPAGASSATSHARTVPLDTAMTVSASYGATRLPIDTDQLTVSLPPGFDWSPADLSAPAPDVTWGLYTASGQMLGAGADADSGTLGLFGSTGSIDISNLRTEPVVGATYTLRVHAAWSAGAPADAGDIVDLAAPLTFVAAADGPDVVLPLGFSHATRESRELTTAPVTGLLAGDVVYLDAAADDATWDWGTGPDPEQPWAGRPTVHAGLVTGALATTAVQDAAQALAGPFAASTPDRHLLAVPMPDPVNTDVQGLVLTAVPSTAPDSGPNVEIVVRVPVAFAGGSARMVAGGPVTLTGTARLGRTLAATSPTWAPSETGSWTQSTIGLSYQWYRGSVTIVGATARTYAPVLADLGRSVTVVVTARSAGYLDGGQRSRAVVVGYGAAPRAAKLPSIVITTRVGRIGKVLSVRPGTWSPAAATYRYQWLRDTRPIAGAVSSTLKVTSRLHGHRISCRVTAIRTGYLPGVALTAQRLAS